MQSCWPVSKVIKQNVHIFFRKTTTIKHVKIIKIGARLEYKKEDDTSS